MSQKELINLAKAIHQNVFTMDTHCDINPNNFTEQHNYTQDLETQVTLPKMEQGGLDAVWLVVYSGQEELTNVGYETAYTNAIKSFNAIHFLANTIAPDEVAIATSAQEALKIHQQGKKVVMIGVENGYPIGQDLSRLREFYDLGARYMSLSHNGHSQLCDSNTGEEDDVWLHNGLSDLGKEVIKEMNRLGMMIDVSHPSRESIRQMIQLSKAPIIASHSSARALCDHSRNLDDELLLQLKENGGVVQAVAFQAYVHKQKHEAREAKLKPIRKSLALENGITWFDTFKEMRTSGMSQAEQMNWYQAYKKIVNLADKQVEDLEDFPPAVDIHDFVDHIDYLVQLIGIDHVGISSDFDGGGGVLGWNNASETFNVTFELVNRGYTREQIEKLWSGNILRVLKECQEIANSLKSIK
ncbi:MAG: dipeptidase [bacterium]